jgi:hypothetical protein
MHSSERCVTVPIKTGECFRLSDFSVTLYLDCAVTPKYITYLCHKNKKVINQ